MQRRLVLERTATEILPVGRAKNHDPTANHIDIAIVPDTGYRGCRDPRRAGL